MNLPYLTTHHMYSFTCLLHTFLRFTNFNLHIYIYIPGCLTTYLATHLKPTYLLAFNQTIYISACTYPSSFILIKIHTYLSTYLYNYFFVCLSIYFIKIYQLFYPSIYHLFKIYLRIYYLHILLKSIYLAIFLSKLDLRLIMILKF